MNPTVQLDDQTKQEDRRPFVARLLGEAVAILAEKDDEKDADGRWSLNTGRLEMITYVWGVNLDKYGWPQPIRLVLDLAKAKFTKPVIPALYAHSSWSIVGKWMSPSIEPKHGLVADLTVYRPKDAIEAAALPDATRVAILIDRDHPWQVSVGAEPRDGVDGYELVEADKTVEVNGQTFAGEGEYPLFIMRRPQIFEGSIVTWGADGATGKLAAALTNPIAHLRSLHPHPEHKETPVNTPAAAPAAPVAALGARLKSLLSALTDPADKALVADLVADGKADDEIGKAVHTAQLKRVTDENTTLKAKLAELEKNPPAPAPAATTAAKPGAAAAAAPAKTGKVEASAETSPEFTGGAAELGEQPKNMTEAQAKLRAEGSKLGGAQLISACYKRWPNLPRHTVKRSNG